MPLRPLCRALAEHFLHKCDLLFAIGSSLFPGRFSHAIPEASQKTIVQCTVDTLDINRSYKTNYALIGDAKLTLQALIQELSAQTGGGVRKNQELVDETKAGKEACLARFRPLMESNEKPINPYRVYGDLMKVLDPQKSFVTGDSGNTRDQISTVYESLIPRGFLGWGNVSTLGFSLAAALGARLKPSVRLQLPILTLTKYNTMCYSITTLHCARSHLLRSVCNLSGMKRKTPRISGNIGLISQTYPRCLMGQCSSNVMSAWTMARSAGAA